MKKIRTILIAGGDLRQVHLASRLAGEYEVLAFGLDEAAQWKGPVRILRSLQAEREVLRRVDALILPMPAMENDVYIHAPFAEKKIRAEELLETLQESAVVLAGKLNAGLSKALNAHGLSYDDYLEREELAVANAVPTAEGALQIMMEELPVTVNGLDVLIVGSGRISKVLRKMLTALGAHVTVSARKHEDFAWIEADHCKAVHTKDLEDIIGDYDLVVNTVPAKVLAEPVLERVKPNALLLDLASKPGGIDFEEANRLGVKTIWALSLPGKVAPLSAGEIIYQTVHNMLREREEDDE